MSASRSSAAATSPTIRQATAGDAAAVEEFLLGVKEFAGTIRAGEEREAWRWLYCAEEGGVQHVLLGAEASGRVVAHYGIVGIDCSVRGERVRAGMAGTMAIDDRYRNSTLFMQLSMRLLRQCTDAGLSFVMAMTNREGLLEYHQAFGFRRIGAVPVYVKPLRFARIARRALPRPLGALAAPIGWAAEALVGGLRRLTGSGSGSTLRIEPAGEDGLDLEGAADHIAVHHPCYRTRDAEALGWRFFRTPFRGYRVEVVREAGRPVGYFALRRMQMKAYDVMAIVDVVFDLSRRDVARAILRHVDRHASASGCDLVAVLTSSGPLQKHLRRAGYLRSPESFDLIVRDLRKASVGAASTSLDDWFVSWYDHDYV